MFETPLDFLRRFDQRDISLGPGREESCSGVAKHYQASQLLSARASSSGFMHVTISIYLFLEWRQPIRYTKSSPSYYHTWRLAGGVCERP